MTLGNSIAPIAIAFAVLDLTDSTGALGMVLASHSVANAVFLLLGGAVADRVPRYLVVVTGSLVAAVTQAAAAALLMTGTAKIWQLAVVEAVNGGAVAFVVPAARAMLPATVTPALLQRANAIARMSFNAATIIGAGIGGLIVAAFGSQWGIVIDAATFLIAAAMFGALRSLGGDTLDQSHSFWRDLAGGWREFRTHTWLWIVVIQCCFVNAAMAAGFWVLGPIVAKQRLGGADAWGFIVAAQSAGFIAGGIFTLRLYPRRPLFAAVLAIGLAAPLLALLAGGAPLVAVAVAAFGCGIGYELYGVYWDTTLQQRVPSDHLSRLYAYDALGSFIFIPLGQFAAAPAILAFGSSTTGWAACTVVIAATLATLSLPDIRRDHSVVTTES